MYFADDVAPMGQFHILQLAGMVKFTALDCYNQLALYNGDETAIDRISS